MLFSRASEGKPESENGNCSLSLKGGGGEGVVGVKGYSPRRSMRRPRKLETTMRHCSLVTEYVVFCKLRKFWQVSRLVRSSRIQRCRSFSERVGPRITFLKASQVSSCSKRSHEITAEPMTKNRESDCM